MRKSIEYPTISYPERRRRWNSSTPETPEEDSPTLSPEKIEGSFTKKLSKQKSHIESNIYRYRSKSFQSKPTEVASQDPCASRKSSLSFAEQLLVMDSIEKGYSLFKSANSLASERPKHVRLEPISQTIEAKREPKEREEKTLAERIEELKQRKLRTRNQKLECDVQENGKLAPLRLVLSNKVRSKIVRDLLGDKDETQQNIQKILERENEHEWLHEFQDLKRSLDLKDEERKRRHHKQLVSRSTYNNVYYEFLALDAGQKKEYLKKSRKLVRGEEADTREESGEVENEEKEIVMDVG